MMAHNGDGNHMRPIIEQLEDRRLFASLAPGFTEETAIAGLSRPVALSVLPDGRWLVAEQGGKLRVVKNGSLLGTAALTLPVDSTSERGLLGLAIDPNFGGSSTKYVYLYYTRKPTETTRVNRVSRFTLSGDTIASGSEKVLLELDPLVAGNHNGGALHFGNDGKLYIAVGDNAEPNYAQQLSSLHGKMLRINADGSIPSDNPFYNTLSGKYRAIWSLGLRNPFSFAVHPTSGVIYINDVGQKSFEEVNVGRAGANYGWPGTEGDTTNPAYDAPLLAYGREVGQAITGGVFYAPANRQFPASYTNDYILGDYVAGWIKSLDPATGALTDLATNARAPVDFDVLSDGSLLYVSYHGTIERIRYNPTAALSIQSQPADVLTTAGQKVTFSVVATASGPISYQWFRNDQAIPNATAASYSINAVTQNDSQAKFQVRLTSGANVLFSRTATLTVGAANAAPVPTISLPAANALFRAGETIRFSGAATDAEDGTLAAHQLDWKVEYITGSVVRPFDTFDDVASGSFVIPTITPYTQTDVRYRITLTATDSKGAVGTTSIDLLPRYSTLNLSSSGASVPILLDGQPQASPASVLSVEGLQRTIEAPASYTVGGMTYNFVSWSDGGPRARTINVPIDDLSLVATYAPAATPSTMLLEAESAALSGGTYRSASWAGYTGTGYADFGGQNSAAQFALNRASAGTANLVFRYANGAGNRPLQIAVNGTVVGTLAFPGTGGWDKWATITLTGVSLPAGAVTIRALANTSAGGANVDSLTISSNTGPVDPPPTSNVDLAKGKTTTASSIEKAGLEAPLATDGSASTRWSSSFADNQWIAIDLGTATVIGGVRLAWEAAYGKSYKIQGSNNASSWTDLFSTTTGDGGVDNITINNTTAWRYVRILGLTRGTKYGFSLFDFNVYGAGSTIPTDPPPSQNTGSISGYAFNDTDRNGVQNGTETRAADKVIYIDANNNGKLDSGELQKTTDSNGNFSFTGLAPGLYRVRRVYPNGYTYSTLLRDITLAANQSVTGVTIGSQTTSGAVTPKA